MFSILANSCYKGSPSKKIDCISGSAAFLDICIAVALLVVGILLNPGTILESGRYTMIAIGAGTLALLGYKKISFISESTVHEKNRYM